mgnify:CR=1 FL=1
MLSVKTYYWNMLCFETDRRCHIHIKRRSWYSQCTCLEVGLHVSMVLAQKMCVKGEKVDIFGLVGMFHIV